MNEAMPPLVATHPVRRIDTAGVCDRVDAIAIESPLQVLVNGAPFAVCMRTPGDDRHLAAGFLLAESVIAGVADVASLVERRTAAEPDVVEATLAPHVPWPRAGRAAPARDVTMNASCGLCGRVTVESIDVPVSPLVDDGWRVEATVLAALPEVLRAAQAGFERSGGLHASGLFDDEGRLVAHAEDVGRHNAVDKVVGRALLEGSLPVSRHVLVVSGRTSFEIVQKAALAGIPVVVAVSAPSTLAVALAGQAGLTLTGFVRDGALNVYTHPERIRA